MNKHHNMIIVITIFTMGGDILTIDKLAENRVLIVLCDKDMDDYSLDYNKMNLDDVHSRKILMKLLQLACLQSGIEIKGRSVILEAIAFEKECYLLITVKDKKTKTYRLKQSSLCYHLGESGNFLDAVEQLYRQNVCCNRNSAYLYNGEYYLIFDYPAIPKKLRKVLSEYGRKSGGNLTAARIRENGRQLCRHNAISQIGKFLV